MTCMHVTRVRRPLVSHAMLKVVGTYGASTRRHTLIIIIVSHQQNPKTGALLAGHKLFVAALYCQRNLENKMFNSIYCRS